MFLICTNLISEYAMKNLQGATMLKIKTFHWNLRKLLTRKYSGHDEKAVNVVF